MKIKLFGYEITILIEKISWINPILKELDKVNSSIDANDFIFSLKINRIKRARELSDMFPDKLFEKFVYGYNKEKFIIPLCTAKDFVEKYYPD